MTAVAFEHEIDVLASQVEREAAKRRLNLLTRAAVRLRLIGRMDTIRAYRRLLLNADGSWKPDAVRMLADLGETFNVGRIGNPGASADAIREREAHRRVVLHILTRADLSGAQLRDLSRKTMETTE